MRSFVFGAALASSLWGCGDDVHEPHGPGEGGSAGESACPPGTPELDDGSCLRAGLPAERPACTAGEIEGPTGACCPAGSEPLASGECRPAGIEPSECAAGFASDGARGCVPILPDAPCAPGEMALLGETSCREIAPCGSDTWSGIPIGNDTQYVDANFSGGANDGTALNPWTTIQAGVNAAAPGAVVAVAAGTYVENVAVAGKVVHIWGRCPALVSIAPLSGPGLHFSAGASSSEVHTLAVTGGSTFGINNIGAEGLSLDSVWIHDTIAGAISVVDTTAPASAIVRRSLFESTHVYAIFVGGGSALVEDSVIRDTQASIFDGTLGAALFIQPGVRDGDVTLRNTLVERNHEFAVVALGRPLLVESSAILDTQPTTIGGHGIHINSVAGVQAELTLRSSYLGGNQEAGLVMRGGSADVATTVIAGTTPSATSPVSGMGIALLSDIDGVPAVAEVRHAVIDHNAYLGVSVLEGSTLWLDGSIIRATQPVQEGTDGLGILAGGIGDGTEDVRVHHSLIAANHVTGVLQQAGTLEIFGTLVSDTQPEALGGALGAGIAAQPPMGESLRPAVSVVSSRVLRSHAAGVLVNDSDGIIELTHVDDTRTQPSDQQRGYALSANHTRPNPPMDEPTLTISWCLFENSHANGAVIAATRAHVFATTVRDVEALTSDAWGSGFTFQPSFETGTPADVTVDSCLIERAVHFGVMLFDAGAAIHATHIVDTRFDPLTQLFGDGIAVMSFHNSAELTVTNSLIEGSDRVGLSSFGSTVSLGRSGLTCNGIDLGGEEFSGRAFSFVDLGGNACGCGDVSSVCRMASAELEPPPPLEPSSP